MFGFLNKLFGPKTDFKPIMDRGAVVIDVRTPEEFRRGHMKGSVNIPLQVIQGKVAEIKKKGKPVIAICRTGNRSGIAANLLKNFGIEAYNGGAWDSFERSIKQV